MEQGTLEIGGGAIHWETAGSGENLVFCHAAFLDSRMWDGLWADLATRYRVVRFDMRGYGRSGPATGPVCRRQDLRAVLAGLGIASAHFVGCSMGGENILDLALESPDLVKSMVLVNSTPSGFVLRGEPPVGLFEMFDAVQKGEIERASELQLRIWFDGPQRRPEETDQVLRQEAAAMNRRFLANNTYLIAGLHPAAPLVPPAVERLHEVRQATMVLSGPLDHEENRRASRVLADGIRGAVFHEINGTAHVSTMEKPQECGHLIKEFLARVG
jgi:pimeloyl-ACP methyl ester carboxylesterase